MQNNSPTVTQCSLNQYKHYPGKTLCDFHHPLWSSSKGLDLIELGPSHSVCAPWKEKQLQYKDSSGLTHVSAFHHLIRMTMSYRESGSFFFVERRSSWSGSMRPPCAALMDNVACKRYPQRETMGTIWGSLHEICKFFNILFATLETLRNKQQDMLKLQWVMFYCDCRWANSSL